MSSETFLAILAIQGWSAYRPLNRYRPWKTRIIVSWKASSTSCLLREEALADVPGERPVPAVDLDEGLRVARLEVQNQESVVQGGIAARRLALVGNPDNHQSATHWNVGGGSRVARSARIVGSLEHRVEPNTSSTGPPRSVDERSGRGGLGSQAARSCSFSEACTAA